MSFQGMNLNSSLLLKQSGGEGNMNGWVFGLSVAAALSFVFKWWLEHLLKGTHSHRKSLDRSFDMDDEDDDEDESNKKVSKSVSEDSAVPEIQTTQTPEEPADDDAIPESPDLGAAFVEAAEKMRQTKIELSVANRLTLYGLYKQATTGDPPKMSWSVSMSDQSKHHAWSQNRGMAREVAALHYVELAMKLLTEMEHNNNAPAASTDLETLAAGVTSRPVAEQGPDKKDMTPEQLLLVAAGEDDIETLRFLLESGVAVNTTDEGGQSALHMAADAGAVHCLKLLLEQDDANVCAADQYGISVLQAAVIAGNVEAAKLLLERGADPDQADQDGDTPRNCAVDDGKRDMRLLFRIGGSAKDESIVEGDEEEEEEDNNDDKNRDKLGDLLQKDAASNPPVGSAISSVVSWDTEGSSITSPNRRKVVIEEMPQH